MCPLMRFSAKAFMTSSSTSARGTRAAAAISAKDSVRAVDARLNAICKSKTIYEYRYLNSHTILLHPRELYKRHRKRQLGFKTFSTGSPLFPPKSLRIQGLCVVTEINILNISYAQTAIEPTTYRVYSSCTPIL